MTAIDRYGNEYQVGEIVRMKNDTIWPTMDGKEQEIVEITTFVDCESGFHVLLRDVESGNVWKNKDKSPKAIDTNWIQKLDHNKKQVA